jgi:hypothetical protein
LVLIYDSTEEAIQKMIEASQRMLAINSQGGEPKDGGGMNPAMKGHLELEIKTLQNSPRDADDKLEWLFEEERKGKGGGGDAHVEDTCKG